MTRFRNMLTAAIALAAVSTVAHGSVLYDNGPLDGQDLGWTINFGFAVADSFTLTSASTVTGVTFGVWNFPGDATTSVNWAITNGANTFPLGVAAAVTDGTPFTNQYGYSVAIDSFSTGAVNLGAGTWYLVLQNASTPSGDPIYWDLNNGPSTAYENQLGNLNGVYEPGTGSETFTILGTSGVPEPATWAMMLMGFFALGAGVRGARRRTAALAA
jgi:hypothetical protein